METIIWSETGVKNGVKYAHSQKFVANDGGRSLYFRADEVGDCVTRAIAIASGLDYKFVYDSLFNAIREVKNNKRTKLSRKRNGSNGTTPRNGVGKEAYHDFLLANGFKWVPLMKIGTGCKVHLRGDELPKGRLVCRVSKHMVAVIDGVVHDTYDPSRAGTRAVYGYYINEKPITEPVKVFTPPQTKSRHSNLENETNVIPYLTESQKDEIQYLIDVRHDTISDDPESADAFETIDTLQTLKNKIEFENNPRFTPGEKKWLIEELSNADGVGILKIQKIIDYVNAH